MKKIVVATFSVIMVVLIMSNLFYYTSTRDELILSQERDITDTVSYIKSSLETNNNGNHMFGQEINDALRLASLAIEAKLPPRIEGVTNDQLKQLANQLGIDDITLMVKNGDKNDFLCAKSSDPAEVGTTTNDWGDNWNRMFTQLWVQQNVKLEHNFGQALPNFWAGPPDTSYNHPDKVYNYGYYNDGKTNYIIDPFISDATLVKFNQIAGVDATIQKLIKADPMLLEIGVVNSNQLEGKAKREKIELSLNKTVFHNRILVDGKLKYQIYDDKKYAKKAVESNTTVSKVFLFKGNQILKTYMPVNIDFDGNVQKNKMVAIVTSDYKEIRHALTKKESQALFFTFISSIIGIVLTILLSRYITRQSVILVKVQSVYSDNIQQLYKTIQEQRHDIKHHFSTLQGLLYMKQYQEMEKYISNLTKVQISINEDVSINIPVFSGLLKTKIAKALDRDIQFSHHFENLETINFDTMKLTEIVRIIGNILSNAFIAVMENEETNRKVILRGNINKENVVFKIYNNGPRIEPEHLSHIFDFGFTTGKNNGGSGIGLASAKKIVESYKGKIKVTSDEEWTTFIITLPISKLITSEFN
ncbi:GHKL domain-containing protein [Bacillus sp. BRMEA1]|uniref:sensor histidine kinase n=1 Tax=Neobacillus endophyticus TaxID=2738405 RepID=UPI0015644AEB|nr:ATP-binding protein [Neobacillus endophyticus]NRD79803.1 GHKL domain-containing protein [Neobacillus endophyticus]